jgi:hypothetical protein
MSMGDYIIPFQIKEVYNPTPKICYVNFQYLIQLIINFSFLS